MCPFVGTAMMSTMATTKATTKASASEMALEYDGEVTLDDMNVENSAKGTTLGGTGTATPPRDSFEHEGHYSATATGADAHRARRPEHDSSHATRRSPLEVGIFPPSDQVDEGGRSRQRRRTACTAAAALLLVCCVVAVVLDAYLGPDEDEAMASTLDALRGSGGGADPGAAPDTANANANANANAGGGTAPSPEQKAEVDRQRLAEARDYLAENSIVYDAYETLSDSATSPQRRALVWICTEDVLRLPVPHHFLTQDHSWGVTDRMAGYRFVQRYVLAVLYFALGGNGNGNGSGDGSHDGSGNDKGDSGSGWKTTLGFLSGSYECHWNERYRTGGSAAAAATPASSSSSSSSSSGGTSGGLSSTVDLGAACDYGQNGDDERSGDGGVAAGEGDGSEWDRVTRIWIPWEHGLSGAIPPEIRHLTHLTSISLAYQSINGTLPEELCELNRLEELSLSNNVITGSLPECLGDMTSLRIVALDDNLLTGDLSVANEMEELLYLYLEDNAFEHEVDDSFLAGLTRLIHLDLSDNDLYGTLPPHLLQHPSLKVLDLHGNNFTGRLPAAIERQESLELLALHQNKLNGTIPSSLGNLTGLTYLDIASNDLTGDLSVASVAVDGIGRLTDVRYLFLGENDYYHQAFPQFLSNMTRLLELSLKKSRITGPIPSWIGTLDRLYLLDLDGNELEGKVPPEIGNLTQMMYLLLNRNALTGPVPPELSNLPGLRLLLLDDNALTGDLNSAICANITNETDIVADCGGSEPEVTCDASCCRLCCEDGREPCNDESWIGNNDPIWEHRYGRYRFVFENESD